MSNFNEFTHLYQLSKTLRFELRPIGETLKHFNESGILDHDETRAESYKKVKKLIDRYHKEFMEEALKDFVFQMDDEGKNNSLSEYFFLYSLGKRTEAQDNDFKDVKKNLREQIAKYFKASPKYKNLFKQELIKEDLCNNMQCNEEEQKLVEEFHNFTTYFTGFHENRKNMYSDEEKSTAIAFRLVHQNLPKFIDNIGVFDRVRNIDEIKAGIENLQKHFETEGLFKQGEKIEDFFTLDYYSRLAVQSRIEIYNAILGGRTTEKGEKIQGLNEYINLYNQQHKEARLPKMKALFKQILSDRQAISWIEESFKSDNEVLSSVNDFYENLKQNEIFDRTKELLTSIGSYDLSKLSKIYITNDQQLTSISQQLYGSWAVIENAILAEMQNETPRKKKEDAEKYNERLKKAYSNKGSFSIAYIDQCLEAVFDENLIPVEQHFANLGKAEIETEAECGKIKIPDVFTQIEQTYSAAKSLLCNPYPKDKHLSQSDEDIEKVKNLLDALKRFQHFIKPLTGSGDEAEKDEMFYGDLAELWTEIDQLNSLYNKVRNHLTGKPYSEEKLKLNFENATLLNGWDKNKEPDNTAIILRKDGLYYLAIMNKEHNRIFASDKLPNNGECYEKVIYKLLPGANKMLPKVFLSKKGIEVFKPSQEILAIYNNGTHKKGDTFNINDCHKLIDFFKESISKHNDWKNFDFHFSDTNSYEDLSGFYREVKNQGYKITFQNISSDYIDNLVNEGKLYLFQIYNKDFSTKRDLSKHKEGTPNMHTLYWQMLFDERNLKDVIYKLNGQAEVFFRKKSLNYTKPTHPANQPIAKKNPHSKNETSQFTYDLIKDKRFTMDKFLFHVPITINFKSGGMDNIDLKVRQWLQKADDVHIIGIDRGERHLLYLTVIDCKGNIKEQMSLNTIENEYNGNTYAFDYHKRLDEKEKERDKAKKSWKTVENIKELKEGYLSQAIHKITQLMLKYNAIIVLEDLNMGFMRGRQKVEKQVYQKFEKMLIDKLNYLADKKKDPSEVGGVLNAYQLTSKFDSFAKLGRQSGFLFYIPAWNTSKIDPVTGFVNLFDTKYKSIDETKKFFDKFKSISYNKNKDWFEFSFDYNDFTSKAEGTKTEWTVCTNGERIENFRNGETSNQWSGRTINLSQELKTLFDGYGIDFTKDLQNSICSQSEKGFFEQLLRLFKLTVQMRNSISNTEIDYLISPVCDKKGVFYDSREDRKDLPNNADANGAYNIARKGLMILNHIKQSSDPSKKQEYNLTNKAWLNFVQKGSVEGK